MRKRLEAKVTGVVQGVMFRDFVERKASSMKLSGWVMNNPDGSVSVVAEGEEDSLDQLIWLMWKGPIHTRIKLRVDNIQTTFTDPRGEKYFEIRYE